MLSVLIETHNAERPLAFTLSALVPAVVEGLLRRVVVIDRGSTDETALVAVGAGCSYYSETDIDVALAELRTPWVLFLKPGAVPQEGWEEVARRHMEGEGGPARFSLAADAGLLARLETVRPLLRDGVIFDDLPQRLKPIRLKHTILPPSAER
ncbi:glycosyl transferase [Ochrobactrum sp. CM-21-5]|nr:glycosyl transferase [Ochrobactrum sp. CM-21-5]MBC2884532.1 glycosyl transferase [Ochrobactrum sp. CM-21-5]